MGFWRGYCILFDICSGLNNSCLRSCWNARHIGQWVRRRVHLCCRGDGDLGGELSLSKWLRSKIHLTSCTVVNTDSRSFFYLLESVGSRKRFRSDKVNSWVSYGVSVKSKGSKLGLSSVSTKVHTKSEALLLPWQPLGVVLRDQWKWSKPHFNSLPHRRQLNGMVRWQVHVSSGDIGYGDGKLVVYCTGRIRKACITCSGCHVSEANETYR